MAYDDKCHYTRDYGEFPNQIDWRCITHDGYLRGIREDMRFRFRRVKERIYGTS